MAPQVGGEAGLRAVRGGLQEPVEVLWHLAGSRGQDSQDPRSRGGEGALPTGGGHHGTVLPPQRRAAVWRGHHERARESSQYYIHTCMYMYVLTFVAV